MPSLLIRSLLLFLLAPAVVAQVVEDDFSDGDFTNNPEWTGDTEHFTVVPFEDGNALRSDGPTETSNFIYLSTASTVSHGYWSFRFRHEVNLSNVNGARIYLTSTNADLQGALEGYYIQLGTNNLNRVELWRQDGETDDRERIGESDDAVLPGDANSVNIEVMRDDTGTWTVMADGEIVISGITDNTYTSSNALGVWVRHNATGRDRFFFTNFLADPQPGDITPPYPVAVTPVNAGARLIVEFNEQLDASTVIPGNFEVMPGGIVPTTAALQPGGTVVHLDFSPALLDGDYELFVSGIADLVGNVQAGTSIAFQIVLDEDPPNLILAEALTSTTVRVVFDEPVLGCDTSLYTIDPDVGTPVNIDCSSQSEYVLTTGIPLTGPRMYTVTAQNVEDLAGNNQPFTSADFFFGEFETPAERDIVINEIMYAPSDVSSNEWVELYNRTEDKVFDLADLRFANATSPLRVITTTSTALAPGEYVVLIRNIEAFESAFPGVPYIAVTSFPSLVNSGDTPQILLEDETVIDAVPYMPSWGGTGGVSLERHDPNGPSASPINWASSVDPSGGTPGEQNSVYQVDTDPPIPISLTVDNDGMGLSVWFNEPIATASVTASAFSISGGPAVTQADPADDDDTRADLRFAQALAPGEYVLNVNGITDLVGNVTNDSLPFTFDPDTEPPTALTVRALSSMSVEVQFDEPVEPITATTTTNYFISGGIGNPVEVVHDESTPARVRLDLASPMTGPAYYSLSVDNVEDLHGNAMSEQTLLFFFGDPEPPAEHELIINEIMYAPSDLASNEWIELLNISEKVFDLSEFTLSNSSNTSSITQDPYLLAPGEYVVLIRNESAFAGRWPSVTNGLAVASFPALRNTGDLVAISYAGMAVDTVSYLPSWGGQQGVSLERRSPEGPSQTPSNWASSIHPDGGTPGVENSIPPDTFPPQVLSIDITPGGLSMLVEFDEPLDETTVTTGAFSIAGIGNPVEVEYFSDPEFAVYLTLPSPLTAGDHVLTVNGVSDLLGNTTDNLTFPFSYTPDLEPPRLVTAFAIDESRVRVRYSEPVDGMSAGNPANYRIDPTIGEPTSVEFDPTGDQRHADLLIDEVLLEGTLYTVTATQISDIAGNVQPSTSVQFYYGEPEIPEPGDILVNEIMFREAPDGTEYVELLNISERIFDLSGFTISNRTTTRTISEDPVLLPPNGYMAIARDVEALRIQFGDEGEAIELSNLPSLRNTDDAVVVRFGEVVIDSVYYFDDWHRPELRDARGVALERLSPELSSTHAGSWTSSLSPLGGTPGLPNSVSIPPGEAPGEPGLTITPSPFDADAGTVVRYRLESDAASVRIRIFDAAGRQVRTLEDARLAGSATEGEVVWNGRNDRGERLRIGIYIVYLEAVDIAGARTEAYRSVVVLARNS